MLRCVIILIQALCEWKGISMNNRVRYSTIIFVIAIAFSSEPAHAMAKKSKFPYFKRKETPAAPATTAATAPVIESTAPPAAAQVAAPAQQAAPAAAANDSGTFDFEALKKLLKDNKNVKSVDDVIPLLPESYRKNYT